jgi:bacterioferritin
MKEFLTDVETLRRRAREHMERGPVTDAYGADLKRVIFVLNQSLATELVCVLRYKRHYYTAQGLSAQAAAAEFLEHAGEEQEHADMIATRITQLGGEPDFNPETLTGRSHTEYDSSKELETMIREDLVAERVAIASYTEIIAWLGDGDPTTRRMLEEILAVEEEHAEDMLDLLDGIN